MSVTPLRIYPEVTQLGAALDTLLSDESEIYLITDSHVAAHCLPGLIEHSAACRHADILEVEPGEGSKSPEIAAHCWNHLAEAGATRHAKLVCLGGGVVTDLGGFIASTYKRGIPFVLLPTSLMAMADAAIGGKTGIDLGAAKNVVGTFARAEAVLVCPEWLASLPQREWESGLAEMLKHGLVANRAHWNTLLALGPGPAIPAELLETTAAIKLDICKADPWETGPRRLLNFGHTFGHALESTLLAAGKPIPHGHCIAAGMQAETILSANCGLLPREEADTIVQALMNLFAAPPEVWPTFDALEPFFHFDKKRTSPTTLNFTLLRATGEGIWDQEMEIEEACRAWTALISA